MGPGATLLGSLHAQFVVARVEVSAVSDGGVGERCVSRS